jgi:hypothetical protein
MTRYKVVGPWGGVAKYGSFYLQSAEIQDTKTGIKYDEGAFRVVDARKGMKPAKLGKGGTVPFFGELAWADGQRLLNDLGVAEQYGKA